MGAKLADSQVKKLYLLTAYARVAAVTVTLIGVTVLAGWLFDLPMLRSVVPGWTAMVVNTASMLAVLGVGLWCATLGESRIGGLIRRLSAALALLAGG